MIKIHDAACNIDTARYNDKTAHMAIGVLLSAILLERPPGQ